MVFMEVNFHGLFKIHHLREADFMFNIQYMYNPPAKYLMIPWTLIIIYLTACYIKNYLSENIASQCFVHQRRPIYKLKQVHPTAVFLHHHLYVVLILKHI